MKISNLLEMSTPSSSPDNMSNMSAPKFGRSDEMLESGVGAVTTGSIGASAKPMGKIQKRGQGSMFQGISTSSKYPNSRKAGIKEDAINEDDLSEEQLQAKQRREENFKKAKDRELGNKPKSNDIVAKEATGRGKWDTNASDYEGDYGGSRNWGRRQREDDEHHHLDRAREKQEQSGTWYVTINGRVVKDKAGQPYMFHGKAAANKAALTMQAKPFNAGKKFMLTTNPNPPEQGVAEGSENYNGIQLSLSVEKDDEYVDDEDTDNQTVYVQATSNGRELGSVLFAIEYDSDGIILVPQDLEVDERFRGQGIAATMYDYVKSKGYRIRRSHEQTDAGAGFWDKHKPGKDIWEQGVAEGFNGEYDGEASMAEGNLHTLTRAVKGLMDTIDSNDNLPEWCQEKIAKAEMMLVGVWDYLLSQKEQGIDPKQDMSEVAPPGAKAERMVKHIKKGYTKDGKITPKEKSIAYATAWKAHNAGKVEEESKGLWANIHAKRERIKNGSGEHMRKPGSKGAPTASALRKSAK